MPEYNVRAAGAGLTFPAQAPPTFRRRLVSQDLSSSAHREVMNANLSEFQAAAVNAMTRYIRANRHSQIPTRYETEVGLRLGIWAKNCRARHAAGILSADIVAALDKLPGWAWDNKVHALLPVPTAVKLSAQFEQNLAALDKFVAEFGHAGVPQLYVTSDGVQLGQWVKSQRKNQRRNGMSMEAVALLEARTGWVWAASKANRKVDEAGKVLSVEASVFAKRLASLRTFADLNGHAEPGLNGSKAERTLHNWVATVRQYRRRGQLRPARITALESIPIWTWEPNTLVAVSQWTVAA